MELKWTFVLFAVFWVPFIIWRVFCQVRNLRKTGMTLTHLKDSLLQGRFTVEKSPTHVQAPPPAVILIIFLIGSMAALGGIWLAFSAHHFVRTATPTQGQVIQTIQRPGKKTYAPEIRFKTSTGLEYTFVSGENTYTHYNTTPKPGTTIKVLYLASDPHRARIDSFSELWLFPLAITLLGMTFLIAACASYMRFYRSKASSSTSSGPNSPQNTNYDFPKIVK